MKAIRNLRHHRQIWRILTMFGMVGIANADNVDPLASMNGKYSELLQTIHCPTDAKKYGVFKEHGYWAGEDWCGYPKISGYLVWVSPNWYLWRKKIEHPGETAPLTCLAMTVTKKRPVAETVDLFILE